ncbi:MAG: hypothetical protein FWG85_07130 [Bacteroidetes bacterium]|nr:hypothetical protein [Bacteroidota bacterium]
MKKYFIFLFVFSNTLLFAQNPPFNGIGDGSIGNPYQIWTKAHIDELSDSVYNSGYPVYSTWHFNKHFRLMTNIIEPLTKSIGELESFRSSHFHGGGHKINVAIISSSTPPYSAPSLFSSLYMDATLDSLIVDGYILDGMAGITTSMTSGLNLICSISYCINNVTIVQNGEINPITGKLEGPAGGIVYMNSGGTISHCINNGDITGVDRIGGIAGENSGTIINCINTGNITATASGDNNIFSGVGGIVGTVANHCQNILNCVNIGSVVGQGFVGGIVGLANGHPMAVTPITNCINYGYVRGINGVGGVLGYMFNPQGVNVTNSVNVGVVEGEEDIGSIVGKE